MSRHLAIRWYSEGFATEKTAGEEKQNRPLTLDPCKPRKFVKHFHFVSLHREEHFFCFLTTLTSGVKDSKTSMGQILKQCMWGEISKTSLD